MGKLLHESYKLWPVVERTWQSCHPRGVSYGKKQEGHMVICEVLALTRDRKDMG